MLWDVHIHLFTTRMMEAFEAQLRSHGAKLYAAYERRWERDLAKRREGPPDLPVGGPRAMARRWLGEMDRNGVQGACFLANVPLHDEVAAFCAEAPGRLLGIPTLDPTRPGAAEDLDRAVTEHGVVGLKLYPVYHRFDVADPRCEPVWDVVERHGLFVLIHFGISISAICDLSFGNPMPLASVCFRHPSIPFLLCHFGTGFFREALMLGEQYENVRADTSSSNSWRWRGPRPLTTKEIFARSLEVFGPERIVFGTDSSFFPRGWRRSIWREQREVCETLGLSGAELDAIFGGNLVKLLPAHVRPHLVAGAAAKPA